MTNHLLTIYIIHFRRLPQLKKTVECLEKNTSIAFKLKILNNGYIDDETIIYLKKIEQKDDIEIIYSKKNIGASRGRALLAKNISTPFLMALDDDMYVNQDWDRPIFDLFKKNKKVGAGGFISSEYNGKTWFLCGKRFKIKGKKISYNKIGVDINNTKNYLKVDDVSSGAIVYRRELMNIIKWDPFYFVGFEDLQKGIYLMQSDYKCFISTRSRIIHDKLSKSPKYEEYNKKRRDYNNMRRSYIYFVKKNKLRFDFKRHIYYKYICLLPNLLLRYFTYFVLYIKK